MSAVDNWRRERASHWLTSAWSEGLCKALTLINPEVEGSGFSLEAKDPRTEAWNGWEDPVWVLFPCDLADAAGLSIGCSSDVLKRLGGLALEDSEDADGLGPETFRELISQAAASVAGAMKSNLDKEARFAGGVDVAEPADASLGVEFVFEIDGEPGSIALVPNLALVEALDESIEEEASSDQGEALSEQPDAPPERDAESLGGIARRNLEMLLDLEMEVTVSFGQTEMPLDDVLKLSVGSIVELNCQASDPVEVLVNDTVIARGEVVVIDSNYGVRITDVSSRKERIQTIF